MHTKEKPTMAVVGDNGNGKESVNTNIAQNDIENLLETSFNKNDYSRIVGLIRQEPTEVFRNKYIRVLCEKLGLGFGDVLRDIENQKPKTEQKKLSEKLRSFEDIIDSEDIETKYVINKLLPENFIMLLAGRRGTKKSLIALRMAIDIVRGDSFLTENWRTTATEVVYIDLENSIKLIKKRLRLLAYHYAYNLKFLLRQDILSIDIEKQIEELKELVKDKVVIIDTLSKIHRRDENSNPHMTIIMEHLINLAQTEAKALILLHHKGKGLGDLGSRGATAIEDNADVVIEIIPDKNYVNFKCTKHRDCKEEDISRLLEINFTDEEIQIKDVSDQEFNIFFQHLKDEYNKDESIFSTQSRIVETMKPYGYSRETVIDLLSEACDYELLKRTKGENNSTRYCFN
ncbi:MAG: AAA family ATPase [Nitrospiraceae bacterium]|nr:AAA family ATPase [Nitrospiraceae bacterium]